MTSVYIRMPKCAIQSLCFGVLRLGSLGSIILMANLSNPGVETMSDFSFLLQNVGQRAALKFITKFSSGNDRTIEAHVRPEQTTCGRQIFPQFAALFSKSSGRGLLFALSGVAKVSVRRFSPNMVVTITCG